MEWCSIDGAPTGRGKDDELDDDALAGSTTVPANCVVSVLRAPKVRAAVFLPHARASLLHHVASSTVVKRCVPVCAIEESQWLPRPLLVRLHLGALRARASLLLSPSPPTLTMLTSATSSLSTPSSYASPSPPHRRICCSRPGSTRRPPRRLCGSL